ncbi:PH domain-containing protein [Raineyella antarctica]|uniref:PH domain-containing protein n=1 Tax=Raineyella antarctica TaxID=1577474 RepID=A0A1G6GU85_9ACTN|nr:PH domain-containing protein [Raineyella antarctica]SDB85481.1 PH domain-containing protein [Raineyella antarctica]
MRRRGFLERWLDPRIDRHLISDEGEVVIDEVAHHWVVMIKPVGVVLLGVAAILGMPFVGQLWWLLLVVGIGVVGRGLYRIQEEFMDRFVITNMRVFRVHGVFSQRIATVPMTRILDIDVHKPVVGRVLGYGHFTFESAAQDQGLRDIRYVGRPDERDLTIQRVIQRSGQRKAFRVAVEDPADDGT